VRKETRAPPHLWKGDPATAPQRRIQTNLLFEIGFLLDFGKITETRFFGFICHLTYAPATLRRRLKNLVSVGSPPPFSAFAKLQFFIWDNAMSSLELFLKSSAARHHNHLCPRQVLGVRIGMYAAEWFGIALPQDDKRVFVFVETDGCLIDGITAATGCSVGRRTMRVLDYGKTAATFVDTLTERAVRITPARTARARALAYAPNAPDRWHAQLAAYQIMPNDELLIAHQVMLTVSLKQIISQHGLRVVCERCGEDIINERYVMHDDQLLCQPCAGNGYYVLDAPSLTESVARASDYAR
jgi:formylmethanofuran dehydrogenase subunit E